VSRKERYSSDYVFGQTYGFIGEQKGDVKVMTSLDSFLQQRVEDIIAARVTAKDLQAAVVVMGFDGAILAMVGGVDYQKSQFNRATMAKRQVGSTFKTFVYLAALASGMTAHDLFDDESDKVANPGRRRYGTISLDEAFSLSLNTIAVQVAEATGIKNVRRVAEKFGVNASCVNSWAVALGVCSTSVLDMTAAYAQVANGGFLINPYVIDEIWGEKDVIYRRLPSDPIRIMEKEYISALDSMLENVIKNGTGKKAMPYNGKAVKGKTGTSQKGRDSWFIGYDDKYVVGVWLGYDDERHTEISGSGLPALIFKDIMEL
jgi:penicillin-binding protein 1A